VSLPCDARYTIWCTIIVSASILLVVLRDHFSQWRLRYIYQVARVQILSQPNVIHQEACWHSRRWNCRWVWWADLLLWYPSTQCELVFSTGLWSCSCISTGSLDTIIMIAIKHQKRVTSLHMIRQVLHEVHDLVLDCTVGRPLYNPEHRLPLSSNRDVGTGEHSYTITSFKSSSQACCSPSKCKYIRFVTYTSTWPTLMCLRATAILTTFFGIDLLKIPCHCASYYSICPVTIFRSTASCIGSGYVSGGCATWKIFSKLRTVYLIGLYLAWLFLLVLGHCDLLVTVCHGLHILCKSTTDVD